MGHCRNHGAAATISVWVITAIWERPYLWTSQLSLDLGYWCNLFCVLRACCIKRRLFENTIDYTRQWSWIYFDYFICVIDEMLSRFLILSIHVNPAVHFMLLTYNIFNLILTAVSFCPRIRIMHHGCSNNNLWGFISVDSYIAIKIYYPNIKSNRFVIESLQMEWYCCRLNSNLVPKRHDVFYIFW